MRSALVLLTLAAAGCASTGSAAPGRTTVERSSITIDATGQRIETTSVLETKTFAISATPAELWRALPLAYGDLGIALAAYDSVQMMIGNPGLALPGGRVGNARVSRYLNCGVDPLGSQLADRYNVRLSVVSRVRAAGTGTLLETQVTGDAAQRGATGTAVNCASTGVLEDALSNAVKLRLAGSHPR